MRVLHAGRARTAVVVLGWIAAAAVAGFIGIAAIGAVGDGIVGSSTTPLSADQVDAQLEAIGASTTSLATTGPAPSGSTPPTSAAPPPTVDPAPPTTPPAEESDQVGINTAGGDIIVQCRGARPLIINATPAQGFRVEKDDDEEGEGRARVEFESEDERVRVEIVCVDGQPQWSIGD